MSLPPPLKTSFSKMFNLDYPIVGAPMFLVSDEKLVTAVSQAGGMGTFPALNYRPIENYRKAIQKIKKTTPMFGINIIVQKANKYKDDQIDIAIEEEVPLLITSLGNPKEVIKRTRGTKTKVFCDVVGNTHAKKVIDQGADGLILVGSGAGGHGGDVSLFALIPTLKKKYDVPLLAAGCITDGKGLAAALALGADGIYMGTRIIASKEATVSKEYKKSIVKAGLEDIINTDKVDGFPGNFIEDENLRPLLKSSVIDKVSSLHPKLKRNLSLFRAARSLFGGEDKKYSYKNVFSAGQGVDLIDKVLPIETILHDTINEYREIKKSLPK